jgi:NAD(P)-dependent dehydrogenase (short-subunit alcohol dehydrogenase family)
MISQGNGLIVNISYWAARKHIGNTLYGMSKAATDKMSSDMGQELRPHRVAVISLYPGLVRTEAVMEAARNGWLDISNSESPEYLGRVISVLVNDQRLMDKSGQALVAAVIGREYGVQDVDGRFPEPLTLSTS